MNESDKFILASTFLDAINPFLSPDEYSEDIGVKMQALKKARLDKIEASLNKPKIKAITDNLNLSLRDDKYLSLVIEAAKLLQNGDRVRAVEKKMEILHLFEAD